MESQRRDTNLGEARERRERERVCVYGRGEGQAQVPENGVHYNQCLQDMNSELQSLHGPIHLLWLSGQSCFSCSGAPLTPPALLWQHPNLSSATFFFFFKETQLI